MPDQARLREAATIAASLFFSYNIYMAKDYYQILGVNKSASAEDVKGAFRKLAHEYHPDKQSGNAEKFKEINEAYQVLGNADKRRQYDQFGQTFSGAGSSAGGGPGGYDFSRGGNPFGGFYSSPGGHNQGNVHFDFGDLGDLGDLGDIFGSFFGGGGGRQTKSQRGADMEAEISIAFEDAVFGTEKIISLDKKIICGHCSGTGAEPGSKISSCANCGGRGQITRVQQTILGNFQTQTVCPDCQGEGKRAEKKCAECRGQGTISGSEKIKIQIPAGIEDGQSIKLSGKGEASAKGQSGDLYIRVSVAPSRKFKREKDDILTSYHISIKQAILGDKALVDTVDGPVNLKIPEGTPSGARFVLKGKGVPHLRSHGRGDQIVEVIVDIPKSISRSEKKILEQLDI